MVSLGKKKVKFDHELLRKELKQARKSHKMNVKYAGEACGIERKRFSRLERGYAETRERVTHFTIHEVLSICLAFDLDIWSFVAQESSQVLEGSESERRDRAWAEAQLAWQITAELRHLLKLAMKGPLTVQQEMRAEKLVGCP